MATKIYLASGDEFTVLEPYANVLHSWHDIADRHDEFTQIWWTCPDHVDENWPAYRSALITIDLEQIVAVERIDEHVASLIDQAIKYEHSRK